MKLYDVIVIGAGSGLLVSNACAQQGKSVAIIDQGPFGGTCLNRGCIPSKMLIHVADVCDTIRASNTFGINSKITSLNWKQLIKRVTTLVDTDAKKIEINNQKTKNITIYKTQTQFIDSKTLSVRKEQITAKTIFICAGTRPFIPPIPGLDKTPFITSDQALRLQKQPRKLIIVGGGYIGTELAHFFGSLGTHVTIIDRNELLMKNEDIDIAKKFTTIYKKKYSIHLNTDITYVEKKGRNICVHIKKENKKSTLSADTLLIATGRQPNTDTLNVSAAGISTTKKGYIEVNDYLETNIPRIYAFGDIIGKYMFKHAANLEAQYAFTNAFGKKIPVDYTAMPHAAFTSPQIASVGKTEQELKNTPYLVGTHEYKDTGYGIAINDLTGFVKILASPKGKILGCHIIGTDASVLIHEVIVAMKASIGIQGIINAVHVHPALSEVVQRACQAINK